jgi:glyoxylase-like metal-dependent hydrolase (beta-lactamase superfamily II)
MDDGIRLLLFDPLGVPSEIFDVAAHREPVIVLTAPWHERDAQDLARRLDAPVYAPRADTAADLMQKYGASAEQAGDGSPDLGWLRSADAEAHWYAAGDHLPFGIEAFAGYEQNDLVLWIEAHRALVAADLLSSLLDETAIQSKWLRMDVPREQLARSLRELLALPAQLVLPTHGTPSDRAALERALS